MLVIKIKLFVEMNNNSKWFNKVLLFFAIFTTTIIAVSCSLQTAKDMNKNESVLADSTNYKEGKYKFKMQEDELKKKLDDEQYYVTQEKGTERPFHNKYWDNHEAGMYKCVVCGQELFNSDTKFESGTGWPSFYQPVDKKNVDEETDNTLWMKRTEVKCSNCGAHLGHLFDDGPEPSGLRYCINSASMDFEKKK